MKSVSIIGAGNIAGALAVALDRTGVIVDTVVTGPTGKTSFDPGRLSNKPELVNFKDLSGLKSQIILIAVSDSAIVSVAKSLAGILQSANEDSVALHLSGALTHKELDELAAKGFMTGSLHPLISVSDPVEGAEKLGDAFWTFEGHKNASALASELVEMLGGQFSEISSEAKVTYHAAAVMSCGHVVALMETATQMLIEAGIEEERAEKMLYPLLVSTIENLGRKSKGDALTGPFKRLDTKTIENQLDALETSNVAGALELYKILGLASLELVRQSRDEESGGEDNENLILLDKTLRR